MHNRGCTRWMALIDHEYLTCIPTVEPYEMDRGEGQTVQQSSEHRDLMTEMRGVQLNISQRASLVGAKKWNQI